METKNVFQFVIKFYDDNKLKKNLVCKKLNLP